MAGSLTVSSQVRLEISTIATVPDVSIYLKMILAIFKAPTAFGVSVEGLPSGRECPDGRSSGYSSLTGASWFAFNIGREIEIC